jgi:hypothetical protein
MDLSSIVDYNKRVELQLLHPVTQEPTGVKFWVTSSNSDAAKKAIKSTYNARVAREKASKDWGADDVEKAALKSMAACIVEWDFAGNSLGDLGIDPELTLENAMKVLSDAPWIYAQVASVVNDLEAFTQA